jgi:hypothetical protein
MYAMYAEPTLSAPHNNPKEKKGQSPYVPVRKEKGREKEENSNAKQGA